MYRVLIVDDEPFILEGLYNIINWADFGMEIVGHAENGQLAMDILRHTPVDLLISDISMPVMNGLKLISNAREIQPNLLAIILSGFSEFNYLKEAMKLGIENYLLKPINIEELKSTLRTVVEKLNLLHEEQWFDSKGVQILKDNILHRWLKGYMATTEFNERADLLGIQLKRPLAAVSIVRMERADDEVFDLITRLLDNDDSFTPFRDIDGDIVILSTMEVIEEERLQDLLQNIHGQLSAFSQVRISMGSVGFLLQHASQSYLEAKKAMEYFLIYPERAIMDYTELPLSEGPFKSEFPIDWSEYVKLILAKETESLEERIWKDFEEIQRLEGMTPTRLQDIALELIIRFKMELKRINHKEESEPFTLGFTKVREASKGSDLIKAIQEVAACVIDALVRDVKNPVVQQVLKYIHENYAGEFSLKTLGAAYNIHPVYLGQLFHKETNETFTGYINKYRVEMAKEQLKTTHLKVHEIASNVGYLESGYFYKQFKKYVGISPVEYKGLL
ncbi:DNA-binding response regulator [Paenibacillus macquariensis subsp. defensor]|nr:DNA-binding response regulator [Paenibacillus macquariensis subsp. defensor]